MKSLALLFLIILSSYGSRSQKIEDLKIEVGKDKPLEGSNLTLLCRGIGGEIHWQHRKHLLKPERNDEKWRIESFTKEKGYIESRLHIYKVSLKEGGKYRCIIDGSEKKDEKNISLHVQVAATLQEVNNLTAKIGTKGTLSCAARAIPNPTIRWLRNENALPVDARYVIKNKTESSVHISQLSIEDIGRSDNGTYMCLFENTHGSAIGLVTLLVQDIPEVEWVLARSIGPEEMQLKWTVNDNNSPINSTIVYVVKEDAEEIIIPMSPASTRSTVLGKESLKIEGIPKVEVETPTHYQVVVKVTNAIGSSETMIANITMLMKKPHFSPEASLRGSTKDSLSVAWTQPDSDVNQYIDLYRLSLTNLNTGKIIEAVRARNTSDSLFTNLEHGTMYKFTVAACMRYHEHKEECSAASLPVSGKTLSEPPNSVSDVIVRCTSNRTSGENSVLVRWVPPRNSEKVERYKIELKASANFINENGRNDYYNSLVHEIVEAEFRNFTFRNVHPNTNYTVKVYAGNSNLFSSSVMANCETPFWLPRTHRWRWWKSKIGPRTALKLLTPNVSQRNGTICCYRIVVVKLGENRTLVDLPEPKDLPILSFYAAQSLGLVGGYVAEAYSSGVTSKYLLIGDGELIGNWSVECAKCLGLEKYLVAEKKDNFGDTVKELPNVINRMDAIHDNTKINQLPNTQDLRNARSPELLPVAEDGYLSKDENYTGFLIMTVRDKNGTILSAFSDFFNVIQPIEDPIHVTSAIPSSFSASLTNAVYILASLIIILALVAACLGLILCHYHRRRKQLLEDGIDESLPGSLGRIFRTLRRSHTLMSQPGIDVKPIPKDELVTEYLEKLKDSELGFRREFEALPEKFYDRSSRGSDMQENASKNRYPDIKAYDQTRVKLSQINGLLGSNYINANYVMAYKERKKVICAQGPMESTVNDFWRMIVEQRCGLVVMLTNLEETGKVKCVKYWPEAGDPKTFGSITVRLVKEKPYADYMVRTLRAEWISSSSNGTATSAVKSENGDVIGGATSVTNSPSHSLKSNQTTEETKFHEVQQYHYLVWKDFIAPDHPVGVLSFLRRINEAYSPDLGPLLIHCSAGVGRTGTLVALDTLVSELDEEDQASIYNVICDLRHQRNFLVQSLKQYVFVHRALMEHAQFGNTEQNIMKLKEHVTKHLEHNSQVEKSSLEKEFERLSRVIEDRKAFTVANSEMNKEKNRYDFVLPYDTNCVILTPLPNQIGATYINASFITGFDLGESFIVTQDPLEKTNADFWRMVYEQEVRTIVMLSELGSGENHCSKYWPDGEDSYQHITVKFLTSESYPKYNTRSFLVTNTKTCDSIPVTQFQYVGWSGMVGEVPLVTYGIMEVITRVQSHSDANMSRDSPIIVHCSGGGDRSSVYVCLNNCLRQLRREGCVDVFQTTRRIRAQRQFQLQEFAQYEFVYKALVEYVDLKRGENL